jgi:hypothetical protein
VILSYGRDEAGIAGGAGAGAGLRKPVDVGMLIATVKRIVTTPEIGVPTGTE